MKPIKITLILFSIVVTICNCKNECTPEKINIVDLPKYIPYTGNDTLRFLYNNTDTQTFIGQGLERFFVDSRIQPEDQCYQQHESVRITFVNQLSSDEIKMEYVFDKIYFDEARSFLENKFTYYKFYFNNTRYGSVLVNGDLHFRNVIANGVNYNYINVFKYYSDTTYYFAFRRPVDNNFSGIIKINTTNNGTFEIIK